MRIRGTTSADRVLVTFVGNHDPFGQELIEGESDAGPVLSLTRDRTFEAVYLLANPNPEIVKRAKATADAVRADAKAAAQEVTVELITLEGIREVIDYFEIFTALDPCLKKIREAHPDGAFFVSVTSGTPQMHACLLLIVASGEFPARIYNVRPQRFVTPKKPLIAELDYTSSGFPVVRREACHPVPEGPRGEGLGALLSQIGIIGSDSGLKKAVDRAAAFAPNASPVLICGETGTGKELFARLVHRLSGRPADRLITVNCANLGENLMESELFGHVRGAFTGAVQARAGRFKEADGGSLFLDELGELPMNVQAKLLRVLQDGKVTPLGGSSATKVDVRIIAATNRDLAEEIKEKRFREDLLHRIEVGRIDLPPLRDRRDDIVPLAQTALARANRSRQTPLKFTRAALTALRHHEWSGNIRELENTIARSAQLAEGPLLDAGEIEFSAQAPSTDTFTELPNPQEGFSLEEWVSEARLELKRRALEKTAGNKAAAARLLAGVSGINPSKHRK